MVGNSKSGTSAIYFALQQHPDIFMCTPKEPNYFATDLCAGVTEGTFVQMRETEYLELFRNDTGSVVSGEASACYLYSREAARRIYDFNPEAKILIILREPVSFLYSYYTQLLKNPDSEGESASTFEAALALEPQRKLGQALPDGCQVPLLLLYMERVRYADQVQCYLDLFPRDNVRILLYDDFVLSNETVFDDVLDFLQLPKDPSVTFGIHNQSVRVRSKNARSALYDLSTGAGRLAGLQKFIKRTTPHKARKAVLTWIYHRLIFKPVPTLDPETRDKLKRTVLPEVVKLQNLLGTDLRSRWGYDFDVVDRLT
jgi:hypothetical protein